MITNAVRCVPPQNKPVAAEIKNCRPYLFNRIDSLPELKVLLCLGRIAHETTCTTLNIKKKQAPFKHGHYLDVQAKNRTLRLYDSYHCSRYNTNTGRLNADMFQAVFRDINIFLKEN